MTFGSLFAGIGGFDLGLERAGLRCEWQVEIDEYARRVLAKHWPDVRRWDDVRTFPPPSGDWRVDLICGGFPCQDISLAGKGKGIDGERSGLWWEYHRIVRILRPRIVLVENSPGLFIRGFDRVLGSMAALGYDAEWTVLSACQFGAPHMRKRLFAIFDASQDDHHRVSRLTQAAAKKGRLSQPVHRRWWDSEPGVDRVADGVPGGMDRSSILGNAVVPQIAEWLGRRILEVE